MQESTIQDNPGQVRRRAGPPRRIDGRSAADARYTVPDTLMPQVERLAASRGESRDSVITAILAAGVTDMAMGSPGPSAQHPAAPPRSEKGTGPSARQVAELVASDVEAQVDQALERHLSRMQEEIVEAVDAMVEERVTGRIEHAIDVLSARLAERDGRIAEVVASMSSMVAEISAESVRTRTRADGLADDSQRLIATTRALSGNIAAVLEMVSGMTGIVLHRAG